MTEDQLQAIEARLKATTPGVWENGVGKVRDGETRELIIGAEGRVIVAMAYGGFGNPTDCTSADRAFIVAAHNTDMPALIAEVRLLREMILADDPLALTPMHERGPVPPPPPVPVLDLKNQRWTTACWSCGAPEGEPHAVTCLA